MVICKVVCMSQLLYTSCHGICLLNPKPNFLGYYGVHLEKRLGRIFLRNKANVDMDRGLVPMSLIKVLKE